MSLFFERHGFATLAEQMVIVRDVAFLNYRMKKCLPIGQRRHNV